MTRRVTAPRSFRRAPHVRSAAVFVFALVAGVPLLAGCPDKKTTPVVDAAPPPPEDVQTTLVPMDTEDASADADADAKPKYTGPGVNTNVARLKQCCNQLAAEAKRMGS